jgi:hypothetical protein
MSESGASGIMRGTVMSCGREGLFCAGYLGMGPAFTRELQDTYGAFNRPTHAQAFSLISSLLGSRVGHPVCEQLAGKDAYFAHSRASYVRAAWPLLSSTSNCGRSFFANDLIRPRASHVPPQRPIRLRRWQGKVRRGRLLGGDFSDALPPHGYDQDVHAGRHSEENLRWVHQHTNLRYGHSCV